MAQDEARFGLISWHKRRYCLKGHCPPCTQQRKYDWTWVYTALEPMIGASFSMYLPRLDGDCYTLFLQHLAQGDLCCSG